MLKWIKKLFGVTDNQIKTEKLEPPQTINDNKPTILQVVESKPAVKPNAKKPTAVQKSEKKYTREELAKLNKIEIDELAKKHLNVDLDRRKKKETMIDDFIKAQG